MKYTVLFVGLFILGSIMIIPSISASPAVMIASYTFDPSVLFPGDTATLTLTIKNGELTSTQTTVDTEGGVTTTTVSTVPAIINEISITPAFSGSKLIQATTKYEDLGALAPGASIDVTFKIVADAQMPEGLYFLIVTVDVQSYHDVIYPIPIEVRNSTIELVPTNMPSMISMSGDTTITVTAINRRSAAIDDVIITPQPVNGLRFLQESVYLGTLAAGSSQDAEFLLHPLETGTKNLTFIATYKNGDNQHTITISRSLEIIQTLDVAPIITSYPASIQKGGSAKISIEVYNAKTDTITGVIITPICNATVVPSQYFIGSMAPDDVFSATFDIYADTVSYGTQTIGFTVTFKQGDNYYETPVLSKSFTVVTGAGTTYQNSGGSSQQSGTSGVPALPSLTICISTLLIIIIIIVVVLLLFLRWRKRRKAT